MQERRSSIANALELRLSCTNPLIWSYKLQDDIGLGSDLMPSGNKPIPGPMLPLNYRARRPQWVQMINLAHCHRKSPNMLYSTSGFCGTSSEFLRMKYFVEVKIIDIGNTVENFSRAVISCHWYVFPRNEVHIALAHHFTYHIVIQNFWKHILFGSFIYVLSYHIHMVLGLLYNHSWLSNQK